MSVPMRRLACCGGFYSGQPVLFRNGRCRTFRPLNAGYPLRLDGLLLVCGYVGVGFLFHARSAFFAVGMRREHFLYRRGLRALGKLDQLVQRIAHAVGAETVLYGEFESVFVGFVFLLLRELGAGECRHDLAELRVAQLGQRAALGGSCGIARRHER